MTYRCSKCRTTRSTLEALEGHKCSLVRCPECRTRRATFTAMLKHVSITGHKTCDCGHGHHFPHRRGTAGCMHQPWDELFNMPKGKRGGVEPPF